MKRVLPLSLCMLVLFCLAGCVGKSDSFENDISEEIVDNDIESQTAAEALEKTEIPEESVINDEEENMKLYFNDIEIPVIWEDNQTVQELMKEAGNGDIIVRMSMHSDNEQFGPLGKKYTRDDKQTTTHNGDIVLYSGDKIVVFYGSNSWAYTRLGKMNIPESDVTEILSNGDITLKITIAK